MSEPPTLHATALVVGDQGVLIRGASGAGKSALALMLIEAARQDGRFARLVADDRVVVEARANRLVASPPETLAGRVEARGRGIMPVPHEPAAVIRLVIDIVGAAALERLPEASSRQVEIRGISLPLQAIGRPDAASLGLVRLALARREPLDL